VVGAPGERGVIASEPNQGDDDVRKHNDKSVIEVFKTYECLDCLEVSQGGPDADSIGFGGVHGDAGGSDHKAQELNLLSVEQALLGFGVQVILAKMLQDTVDMDLVIFH